MLQARHWPIPVPVLLALALTVLLAHGLALRKVALGLAGASEPISTRAFTTRSIALAPPAAPAVLPRRPVSVAPRPAPPPPKPPRPRAEGVMAAAALPVQAPVPTPAPAAPVIPEPLPEPLPEPTAEPPPEPAPPVAESAPDPVQQASTDPPQNTASPNRRLPGTAAPLASETVAANRSYVVPGSIRLNFDAVGKRGRFEYKAMGTLTWLQDGIGYDMKLEMGDWIIGKRVLSSTGKLGAEGLAPTRFSDKFRSERAAHFNRAEHRITFSANTPQAALLPGAQDQLSIFAQLAAMVAGDPLGFPIGTVVDIQTVGPRDADQWVFAVEREEMLNLPGGQVPTLKLIRKPGKDYDQTVELWLAPQLAYLPARIRITFANGDYLDQQWRSSSAP
ncbi:MAG TPA: DUF3108 domain-containing protein [Burkholderiaceae bacterium]|nr:DUF3108 domain-containing protein [Burkholderiaceae bacterium]